MSESSLPSTDVRSSRVVEQIMLQANQPIVRQLGLVVALALAVAAAVAAILWMRDPIYTVLDPAMSPTQRMEAADTLQRNAVRFRMDPATGAVLVPSADLQRARSLVGYSGGSLEAGTGYELLDADPGFGVSQRMESSRLQRAIEGELTRSIRSLRWIEQARVHLALPQRSVFARQQAKASASVVLRLAPGRRLDESRVSGIQELVASSVPELLPEDVAVLDDQGRLLSTNRGDSLTAMAGHRLAITSGMEKQLVERIERLLIPLYGFEGVRAEVAVDVDFAAVEITSENYNPQEREQPIVRSEQLRESVGQANMAGGVPGALANQPPNEAVLAPIAANQAAAAAAEQVQVDPPRSSDTTRNYEVDRRIEHVRQQPGSLRRLSVAVMLDAARDPLLVSVVPGPEDGEAGDPRQQRLNEIEQLVREAVGFDLARGDTIRVAAVNFQREVQELDPVGFGDYLESPWLMSTLKHIMGALFLGLSLLLVLRPAIRVLVQPPQLSLPTPGRGPASLASPTMEAGSMTEANFGPGPGGSTSVTAAPTSSVSSADKLAQARQLASEDPARVAQLARAWISG